MGDMGFEFNSFLQRVGGDDKKVKIEFEKTPILLERNNDKNQENKTNRKGPGPSKKQSGWRW